MSYFFLRTSRMAAYVWTLIVGLFILKRFVYLTSLPVSESSLPEMRDTEEEWDIYAQAGIPFRFDSFRGSGSLWRRWRFPNVTEQFILLSSQQWLNVPMKQTQITFGTTFLRNRLSLNPTYYIGYINKVNSLIIDHKHRMYTLIQDSC